MDSYMDLYKRMEDVATDELNERKELVYDKLYPVISEHSDAEQLEFDFS